MLENICIKTLVSISFFHSFVLSQYYMQITMTAMTTTITAAAAAKGHPVVPIIYWGQLYGPSPPFDSVVEQDFFFVKLSAITVHIILSLLPFSVNPILTLPLKVHSS